MGVQSDVQVGFIADENNRMRQGRAMDNGGLRLR